MLEDATTELNVENGVSATGIVYVQIVNARQSRVSAAELSISKNLNERKGRVSASEIVDFQIVNKR